MWFVDNSTVWEKVLKIIKEQVSSANFRTWFSQTSFVSFQDRRLVVAVPSAFIKQQLNARYQSLIQQALTSLKQGELAIEYRVDALFSKPSSQQETELFIEAPPPPKAGTIILNPKYTIANFVVGLTNNLAFAAAQAVIQNPGTSYNPLFIYGPSGVGKTHLMQAIGNALIKPSPHLKTLYAPSERFMVDFVEAIQTKKTGEFRAKYRSCGLLLIDDVQFISGKDSTQEEFFHTFNELHSKNTQIVLTSDRPPNEMQKLEARLMSRFQGGLMVDIQLPDFDTRMAILKAKLTERGDSLPEDCLNLLAESIQSNTRELEGKLVQILSLIKLTNQPANIETVKKFLGTPLVNHGILLDHKKVLGQINQYFSIKMGDLLGPRRQKELVVPRQIAMYILYTDCRLPMERIGQILGGRDHTTILYGIKKIEDAVKRDREIQRMVVEVKQALG